VDEDGDVDEDAADDPEMEDFAEREIRKEMKRLQSGAGPVDEDGSDIDVNYTDSEGEGAADGDEEGELAEGDVDEADEEGEFE